MTLENLPAPQRVIVPCRLIFWGAIICSIDFRLNGFDIANDFIGMLMNSWGIVLLSQISISAKYQRWMSVSAVIAILGTIVTFFSEILRLQVHPSIPAFVLLLFAVFVAIFGIIIFCRCMQKYCRTMNWERALASWKYSTRLITYGILLPAVIFAIPMFLLFESLTFVHKNALPRGGWTYTVNFGDWVAPVDSANGMIIMIPGLLFVSIAIWAIVHFLMSLSRTIRAGQEPPSDSSA